MTKFEELFKETKDYICSLSDMTCLMSFYIGKAEDVDKRNLQHQSDGFCRSVEIANSNSSALINEAECFLIKRFKSEPMPVAFDNANEGGGGNPNADKLYVSLRFNLTTIDELEDIDEDNFRFDSINL